MWAFMYKWYHDECALIITIPARTSWNFYQSFVITSIIQDVLKFDSALVCRHLVYFFDPCKFPLQKERISICLRSIIYHENVTVSDESIIRSWNIALVICVSLCFFPQRSKWQNAGSQLPDGTGEPVQRRCPGKVQMWVWCSLTRQCTSLMGNNKPEHKQPWLPPSHKGIYSG